MQSEDITSVRGPSVKATSLSCIRNNLDFSRLEDGITGSSRLMDEYMQRHETKRAVPPEFCHHFRLREYS